LKDELNPATQGGFYVTIATASGSTTKKVDGDTLTVGRADDCNLTISHETLSRRHLTLSIKDGECFAEDHDSSNGSYINGKRIKPHSKTRLRPEDQVTLGQATVKLSVSIEPVMRKEGIPPVPSTADNPPNDTIVTTTSATRRASTRTNVPTQPPKGKDEAQEEAERIVQDAQKRAAMMIQEAEMEAERKVEDIYRRAHETQAKMDEIYQKRMNEAFRASEDIYQKAQGESQKILDGARERSTEIREQAENFVRELRRRTEDDCERLLEEAQVTARDLKEQRILEAQDQIREREADVVKRAQASMTERMARFEQDLDTQARQQRLDLEREFDDKKAQFDLENKSLLETIESRRKELKSLDDKRETTKAELVGADNEYQKSKRLLSDLMTEADQARDTLANFNRNLSNLRTEIDELEARKKSSQTEAKDNLDQLGRLREDLNSTRLRIQEAEDQHRGQILQLKEKLEEARAKIEKEEQQHLENLRLQSTRRVRELELKLVDELETKRDLIARELVLVAETHLKETNSFKGLQDKANQLLKAQISSIATDDTSKAKQESLVALRRRQKVAMLVWGLALGLVGGVVGPKAYRRLSTELSPIQRRVVAAQEERRQDLELRKFNPPQSKDFKATYVDNSVYTENFVATYTSEPFQKQLLKTLTPYMLRTFKLEEEKIIELLGISSTLVKTLDERKQALHPDFVNQGLEKMKELEKETEGRMRELLGTQVRYEAFRKFEKRFFETYQPSQGL
jgi:pSer/pThr/pTyr-binding forkhead associated (FHA) protein